MIIFRAQKQAFLFKKVTFFTLLIRRTPFGGRPTNTKMVASELASYPVGITMRGEPAVYRV